MDYPSACDVDKIDTSSYISFAAEENVRSPRTPTYVPDTPLPEFIMPSSHSEPFLNSKVEPKNKRSIAPPPEEPLAWVWICHLCHSRYPLGVTRRCLVDGHYYCSGETDRPSTRKKRKNKSCSSEFDYVAWKAWGDWRRKALKVVPNPKALKGCGSCDFPSQCRYPAESHPIAETKATKAEDDAVSRSEEEQDKQKSILATANKNIDFDKILSSIFSKDEDEKSKTSSGDNSTNSRKKTGSRKKNSQKDLLPTLEEEMTMDAARLRELINMDLWTDLDDVDLEKVKAE
ncbi:hypothetical protein LTR10_018335 [Elasticomyces elasticus]|uniref:Uncharacterized protein n=1 Tax=Exophiala sideris TaxID=1016849 RepID=A0ABR0JNW5_9EURO|nr:hypothetical protein LTR10_018335 [Elasticomyces elasticus]KAK5024196.1 hypothetical protein LTR13_010979 [Exophiala sideris]KAK5036725.1 hypothetical protein LTS07_002453 [Exophiala sideris]KAK5067109.1 hypothetical protein LTR69_002458 [Exophiala sideris]KAK5186717.1 hypothetical protein LTR44_000723 [Eurotiomycetes sp. CCFEE 6388]